MTPDLNNEAREKMERASLNELMPGFNKEDEWAILSSRLKKKRNTSPFKRVKAAAVFLLIAGGAWLWLATQNDTTNMPVAQTAPTAATPENEYSEPAIEQNASEPTVETAPTEVGVKTDKDEPARNMIKRKKYTPLQNGKNVMESTERFFNYYTSNEVLCNGTQCPLEICIVQTFKCRDAKPSAIATCNTLGPDEAKQLRYKALNKDGSDCKMTVDEIRIKRISTGETIVLNATSKPSTAEELFSCITGQHKCSILAGIFDEDCNNHCKRDNITIHNTQGDLILQ